MIAFAIPPVLKRIPSWLWAAGAFVLILALLVFLIQRSTDQRVEAAEKAAVTTRDAEVSVEALARDIAAREAVAGKQAVRETIATEQTKELTDEARKGTADTVGVGTAAVLRRMREQQAATAKADRSAD